MATAERNRVRIVGGTLRGRRLEFPPADDLRPTPDRVRETLFNWLQPMIAGARCLDLFAGSGALAIEALSRGAAEAVALDRSAAVARRLRDTALRFGLDNLRVVQAEAAAWLQHPCPQGFDLVFLDPPFASDLIPRVIPWLLAGGWLVPGGLVYLERDAHQPAPPLPEALIPFKEQRAGGVDYGLWRYSSGQQDAEAGAEPL